MKDTEITQKLKEPFDPFDIEWRVQQVGKTGAGKMWAIVVPYVTNRAIQERLDEVCGVAGWTNEYKETPGGKGILCGIAIKFQDKDSPLGHEWLTKWDGAEETAIEAVKGGLSSAMKRAAVQWGIVRYLYRLENAIVSPTTTQPKDGTDYIMAVAKLEGKKVRLYFSRPNLPNWALAGNNE